MLDLTTLKKTKTFSPPRLIVYGPEGVGKTTFASQAPDVIFMAIEKGLDGMLAARQQIKTWQDVLDMLTALYQQDHSFKTLAVDSLDWLEEIIYAKVCDVHKVSSIGDIPYSRGPGYALDLWMTFTQALDSLQEHKGMTSILLAHDKVTRFVDPMGSSYDRYVVNLHEKTSQPLLMEWADGVLFMKLRGVVTVEKNGFKESKKAHDAGGVHMYTKKTLSYDAKNRVMLSLPDEFPISRENSWNDFIAQIGKNQPANQGE